MNCSEYSHSQTIITDCSIALLVFKIAHNLSLRCVSPSDPSILFAAGKPCLESSIKGLTTLSCCAGATLTLFMLDGAGTTPMPSSTLSTRASTAGCPRLATTPACTVAARMAKVTQSQVITSLATFFFFFQNGGKCSFWMHFALPAPSTVGREMYLVSSIKKCNHWCCMRPLQASAAPHAPPPRRSASECHCKPPIVNPILNPVVVVIGVLRPCISCA